MEKIYAISKDTVAEQVCEDIKNNIISGVWRVGDKLPSESTLAEAFGVNRLTVRIAIQKLNALGILKTKTGSGTYVVEFNFSDFMSEVSGFFMHSGLFEDVCEFRKLIEVECALLAITRSTDAEKAELKRLAEEFHHIWLKAQKETVNISELHQKFVDVDIAFHEQVSIMSHNALYVYCFSVAKETIYQYISTMTKKRFDCHEKDFFIRVKDDHMDIYRAIVDGDVDKLQQLFFDMIDFST